MAKPRIAIVGAGAAGLAAAIAGARTGAEVTLLERGERVGRKILASGNGRCNLTNVCVTAEAYNRPEFVEPVLTESPCEVVRAFFGDLGLMTYADNEGRVYPTTNSANSVLDVLRLECGHLGVEERLGFPAARVRQAGGAAAGFEVDGGEGGSETVSADAIVIATGGGAAGLLGELGHELVATEPLLCPIATSTSPIRGLSGVRLACSASLLDAEGAVLDTERGELLFRDYGVSGIMVFDLSRFLDGARTLAIDFFPDIPAEQFSAYLRERRDRLGWRSAGEFLDGILHSRVSAAVLRVAGPAPSTPGAELPIDALAGVLKGFQLRVEGKGDIKQAQVTRGGAAVDGFDPRTLESLLVPGAFAAGEVLDVDGRCGGFNLHWAWASGIAAGVAAGVSAAETAAASARAGVGR